MSTIPNLTVRRETSAEDVIAYLAKHGIDDSAIWGHFDDLDKVRLAQLLTDVDKVEAEVFDKAVHGGTKKSFESGKSDRKGRLFEEITHVLVSGVRCFHSVRDVTTTTNQLDLLVELNPTSSVVPALRHWGAHFIAECKFHDSHVSNTWLEKLHSILTTHGASVGLLISRKGVAPMGRGRNATHLLQLFAVQSVFIVCIDLEDIRHCSINGGILQLLVSRFTAARVGARARTF